MKKTLLTSVVLGALMAGNAMAADMAVKAPIMKAPPMAFSWTGFYIGGHAGCGWASAPSVTAFNSPVLDSTTDTVITTESPSGCFSGGQVGADYQFAGGFVVGVLGDIAWGKISGFHQVIDDFGAGGEFSSWETKLTSLGSVRGRIGYAINGGLPIVGGLSWMPYFTGGWAWATSKVSVNGDAGTFSSDSQTLSGWTLGGGIEYAINPSLSWKAEYLYTRFNSATYSVVFDDDGVPPGLTLGSTNVSTFKTGLNWRFGH